MYKALSNYHKGAPNDKMRGALGVISNNLLFVWGKRRKKYILTIKHITNISALVN